MSISAQYNEGAGNGLSTTKPGKYPLSGMSITGTRANLGSWIIPRQVLGPNVPGFWPSEVLPALS